MKHCSANEFTMCAGTDVRKVDIYKGDEVIELNANLCVDCRCAAVVNGYEVIYHDAMPTPYL